MIGSWLIALLGERVENHLSTDEKEYEKGNPMVISSN